MNIIFIGYSVTEMNGYVDFCIKHYSETKTGITIERSGWGGHTIDTIAYMIDDIVKKSICDRVVLELFTSHIRILGEKRITFYLDQILSSLAKIGSSISFLILYDDTVFKDDDFLTSIVCRYSQNYAIPVWDLAAEVNANRNSLKYEIFTDNVHTNAKGSAFYGERIVDLIDSDSFSSAYKYKYRNHARLCGSINLADLRIDAPIYTIKRSGSPILCYELVQNTALIVPINRKMRITGVMLTYAPDSGPVEISSDMTAVPRIITPFDPHSYYIRTGFFEMEIWASNYVSIKQLAKIPDGDLLKGEKNLGPRTGRISHLFYLRDELAEIERRRGRIFSYIVRILKDIRERVARHYHG